MQLKPLTDERYHLFLNPQNFKKYPWKQNPADQRLVPTKLGALNNVIEVK